jgi:nucleoside-diphosphate-sugar epimerase
VTTLVTGAGGFVGSHLVRRLVARGGSVRALVRSPDAVGVAGVESVVGDLGNVAILAEATRGVDTVCHAAAVTLGGSGDLWNTNVDGTRRLMEACVAGGVRRVVVLSSVAVYRPPLARVIGEDAPLGGVESYGRSKTAAEAVVRQVGADRVEWVILRPCQIYGQGDRSGYTDQLLGLLARNPVPVARGSSHFSLIHVDDVVDALELAATKSAAAGGVFNIAGPPTSVRELAGDSRVIEIPRMALRSALVARWLVKAARNRNVRPWLRSYSPGSVHGSLWLGGPQYATNQAANTLGWNPRVSAGEGIARTRPGDGDR